MRTDLDDIETATIGHFLSDGFMSPALQCLIPDAHVCGPALTVRLPGDDGSALVEALSRVETGQVVVVDRCGDLRHACWGAVTTAAAMERGAAGAVIDGFITDRSAILAAGFPVWCRGRSPVTTKLRNIAGAVGCVIRCGGVEVRPNDIVLADESGVLVLDPASARDHGARARLLQDAEPALIEALRQGRTLASLASEQTENETNKGQPS